MTCVNDPAEIRNVAGSVHAEHDPGRRTHLSSGDRSAITSNRDTPIDLESSAGVGRKRCRRSAIRGGTPCRSSIEPGRQAAAATHRFGPDSRSCCGPHSPSPATSRGHVGSTLGAALVVPSGATSAARRPVQAKIFQCLERGMVALPLTAAR